MNEYRVLVGNQKWMMENSVFVSDNLLQIIDEFESRQETAVFVAVDGKVVAIISISDPIKPEARIAIQVNFIFEQLLNHVVNFFENSGVDETATNNLIMT